MENAMFFDASGPISPEEAYRRFKAMSEKETDAALAKMGMEYVEELDTFLEDFILTNLQQANTCISSIFVSAAVGNMADIIDTTYSALVVGAVSYRERLLKHNPTLADQIDSEIHQEAGKIREALGKEHDSNPDETSA